MQFLYRMQATKQPHACMHGSVALNAWRVDSLLLPWTVEKEYTDLQRTPGEIQLFIISYVWNLWDSIQISTFQTVRTRYAWWDRGEVCRKKTGLYFFSSCCIFVIRGAVLFRVQRMNPCLVMLFLFLQKPRKRLPFFLDLYYFSSYLQTWSIWLVGDICDDGGGVVCLSIFTLINS